MNNSDEQTQVIPDAAGILELRRAPCNCCGPWMVESGYYVTEFQDEDEAKSFYAAERIRRLAAVGGITDERRINAGIRDLDEATK